MGLQSITTRENFQGLVDRLWKYEPDEEIELHIRGEVVACVQVGEIRAAEAKNMLGEITDTKRLLREKVEELRGQVRAAERDIDSRLEQIRERLDAVTGDAS